MPDKIKTRMSSKFKLISISAFLIVLILSFLFLLNPKYSEVSQLKQELKMRQEEIANQKVYLDDIILKLISNFQKISLGDIEKINGALPKEKDLAGLFVQMEALAEESGLNLLGLDIAEKKEAPELEKLKVKELDISLNLSGGDYLIFKKFLNIVETNLRFMDITSINFAPETESYALNLKTYYKE